MQVVFLVLIALLLAVVAVGVCTFFIACTRGKQPQWLNEEELKGTSLEKLYPYILFAHQWLSSHDVEEVTTQSRDGLKLHARWVPAENPKGTILLAHGYKSTPYIDFSKVLDVYHRLGMNMLIPDQRCHGKSEGKFITFGVKEWQDMCCWVNYHNTHFGQYPMVLSGLSMGASTVLFMADEELPHNVHGIIADCGFTSPYEIISKVFRSTTHLPAKPFLWVTELCARCFAGFSLKGKDTRITLRSGKYPIILAHGLADDFVPSEMSRQAYEACTSEKELLLVENAGHGYSFLKDQERYTRTVTAFLQKYLEVENELRSH